MLAKWSTPEVAQHLGRMASHMLLGDALDDLWPGVEPARAVENCGFCASLEGEKGDAGADLRAERRAAGMTATWKARCAADNRGSFSAAS